MIRPTPNYIWHQDRALRNRPFGAIFFAHSDVTGLPLFEEACYTGISAAQQAMDTLQIPYNKLDCKWGLAGTLIIHGRGSGENSSQLSLSINDSLLNHRETLACTGSSPAATLESVLPPMPVSPIAPL